MDDSFSRLASQIRRNKINKKEIKKIKKEIIDGKVLNIIKTDMAIKIQKQIRGFIYRKKYKIFLDQINTEMVIDYLYQKKLTRIKSDYKSIISTNILNYIKYMRGEKEKINLKKKESINKIKATMKGIIFRKNFRSQISSLNNIKEIIEKYILGYKIRLILRSNNIQSLLIDIANIKYSLNNIDKMNETSSNNTQKIKELKTKLNKNINLFYFTFYQMKENSNWISQTKISESWFKKYSDIINKNKSIFVKKKSIYSNQKKIKRLKENNNNKNHENKKDLRKSGDYLTNSMNNNTINNDKDFLITNFETEKNNKNVNINIKYLLSEGRDKIDKSYNFNFYDSESDELNNINTNSNHTQKNNKKNNSTKEEPDSKSQSQNSNENNDKKIRCNIVKRYKSKKLENEQKLSSNKSKSSEDKESLNIKINEYKLDDNKEDINNPPIKEKKLSGSVNCNKKLNKYQQREERPIKPLTNINFLENDNPFGLKRESSTSFTETNKNSVINPIPKQKSLEKRIINSTRAINRNLITYNQKTKEKKNNISQLDKDKEETVKTQEKTELSHEEFLPLSNKYLDYDNRPVGGGNNMNNLNNNNKELDRNERPLGGNKNLDYYAMFGEGNEFSGDPFGGAKQFENNNNKEKNKIKNNKFNNNNNTSNKKKPVYDARKAIEEAKIKEAKEGKKEKPSAFREFLREMKKISAEEKAQYNETNNVINKDNNPKVNKKNKNKNKENNKETKEKEMNLDLDDKYKNNNNIEDNPQISNNIIKESELKENKENNNLTKKK